MNRVETERERKLQLKDLLHTSTPEERKKIMQAVVMGGRYRKKVEQLELFNGTGENATI